MCLEIHATLGCVLAEAAAVCSGVGADVLAEAAEICKEGHLPRGSVIRCLVVFAWGAFAPCCSPSKGAAAPSRLCGFGRGMFGRGAFGVFARGVFGLFGAVDRATMY